MLAPLLEKALQVWVVSVQPSGAALKQISSTVENLRTQVAAEYDARESLRLSSDGAVASSPADACNGFNAI